MLAILGKLFPFKSLKKEMHQKKEKKDNYKVFGRA